MPVWHDANWQVWRVGARAAPGRGTGAYQGVGPASFVLDFRHAGRATVRIRGNGMWAATQGEGCVSRNAAGWLTVVASAPGPLTVRARVSIDALGAGARCS